MHLKNPERKEKERVQHWTLYVGEGLPGAKTKLKMDDNTLVNKTIPTLDSRVHSVSV